MSKRGKIARRAKAGGVGGSTGSIEYAPGTVRRMKRARQRTEERWAAKAGPVTVTRKADDDA